MIDDIRPVPGHGVPTEPVWDVSSWTLGPRRPYRVNMSYRVADGAVVTATGSFDTAAAADALALAVRVFEPLACAVVVDVSRAELDDTAAHVLVETARRRQAAVRSPELVVFRPGPGTARRVARAGGTSLLQRATPRPAFGELPPTG